MKGLTLLITGRQGVARLGAWVRARRRVKGTDAAVSCAREGRLRSTGGRVGVSCGGEGRLMTTGGRMRGREAGVVGSISEVALRILR